jgi:hypothetical protein
MLTTGCLDDKDTPIKPQESIKPEKPEKPEESIKKDPLIEKIGPSKEISVSGKIMLGPVVNGHNLQLVIYDTDMKVLYEPRVGLDGSYGFKLKDYTGVVIAQVTSANPDQCSDDYIDEATAKPKCLGKSTILSSRFVESGTTNNQAKLHTTPVTTVAVIHAGVNLNDDGSIALPKGLTQGDITQSNTAIAKVFGLGDKSIAEYTPKSIITTDQKFKLGDAYSNALAEISGIEAKGKSLNSIVNLISSSIGKNDKLSPAMQDMMVKGIQEVFKAAKDKGADASILDQINNRQDAYTDSNTKVDLITAPEPPVFKNKTKTANQQPTWQWMSGGTGNNRYRYRFGREFDLQSNRNWTQISSNSFIPSDNLKQGKYILEIQEGHVSDPTKWSMASSSTIEIIENQKGSVTINGEAIEGKKLIAKPFDNDGIQGAVSYQWYRDDKPIEEAKNSTYVTTQLDVGKPITVSAKFTDNLYTQEKVQFTIGNIKNINDDPSGLPIIEGITAQGETLTVETNQIIDIDGIEESAFNYEWRADNKVILGATNPSFVLTQKEVAKKLSVLISYQDKGGTTEFLTSAPTEVVKKINEVPVANDLFISAKEQVPISIKLEGSDVDHPVELLTYRIMEQPNFGDFIENPSNAMTAYKSNSDTETQDSFSYKVCDPANSCSQLAKVTINITAQNDAPVASPQTYDNNQEKNKISLITLSANDAENDTLTFKITKLPINGELFLEGEIIKQNQSFKSTDNLKYKRNLYGVDSFEYVANDGSLDSDTSIVKINYENKAPELLDKIPISANEQVLVEIPITVKDDLGKDTIKIKLVNPPVNGEIYINGSKVTKGVLIPLGSHNIQYKSTSDYAVNDSFEILANDGHLDSNTIKVSIAIIPEHDPPRITQTNDQIEDVDIYSKPLAEYKFQIAHDRGFGYSYRHRNLSLTTPTDQLNSTWIERQIPHAYPKKSDNNLFWTFDFQYNLKANIRDNPLKDSLRVVLRAEENFGDKLNTYYAFVIKPTKIIDEENNIKLQHNLTWVDVCWKISKNISNSGSEDNNIEETKRTIIETITNSWQKHSALQFDWREDNWSRAQLTAVKPSNCSDNYTSTYPQIQVHLNVENDSSDSDASSDRNIVAININEDGRMTETDESVQTYKIIHAFGHALGFPDENKRFDTFIDATNKSFCDEEISFNLVAAKSSTKSDFINTNAVKIISYKDWEQQPYDPISIMNECRFTSSSSELSANDIKRVQQYYGIRIVDNPHLIKEDEFFTGLYLKGDEYFYYYNGVKSKNFASIKKSEIETLGSDIYFELASNDKKKSILFRYEKGGDYTKYIEPENSSLTHCEKIIIDSQNRNTNDNLKLDLVCQTVSKFKEDSNQGDGSIYYRVIDVDDIYVEYCEGPKPQSKDCIRMQDFLSSNSTLYVKGISYDNIYLQ